MKTFTNLVEERRKVLGLTKPSACVSHAKAMGFETNDQFWRNYRRERIGVPHWAAQTITRALWSTDAEMGRLVLATHRPSVVVHGTVEKIKQYARIMHGSVMDEVDVDSLHKVGMFWVINEGDAVLAPQRKNFKFTGVLLDRAMFDAGQVPVSVMKIGENQKAEMCDIIMTSSTEVHAAINHGNADDQREALLNAARGIVVRL